jgi:hypothetical protein
MELPDEASGQRFVCPTCEADFVYDDSVGERNETQTHDKDELNTIRIKLLANERRAIVRTRSYFIIAAGGCAVGAAQLIYFAVHRIRAGGTTGVAVGYLLFAVLFGIGLTFFLRKANEIGRKL